MPSPILKSDSAHVYLEYDPTNGPPPPPSLSEWTRFVCLSDTHSRIFNIPPGDVLLHSGDISSWGYPGQILDAVNWLKSLSHPVKIVIAGNHDLFLDKDLSAGDRASLEYLDDSCSFEQLQEALKGQLAVDSGFHYLEHESYKFTSASGQEWSVYGSPSAPRYSSGAFQYATSKEAKSALNPTASRRSSEELNNAYTEIYDAIPLETDVLLTHTPARGILDLTSRKKHAGCPTLETKLDSLQCRLHVFGHIHEGRGAKIGFNGECSSERISVNAALPKHGLPIVVDLRNI